MSSPRGAPQYSVLILGGTQAGKSAFIEHVRSYADPDYVVDESLLGDGITSKTDTTIPFLIESNLPSYEAFQKNTGETFDLSNLAAQYKDDEDYRDVLLSNAGAVSMRMVSQDPVALSQSMEFRLLDTPGLNGTQGKDSEHAASIVNEIISTRSFNLIVFVISSKSPLTEEKQVALEYFAYVLRGLHSRIIFLHTHVDYSKSHHSNTSHHLDMSMRSKAISRIFRRHDGESVFDEVNIKEYPCFNIDLTARNRPIVQCMIRNTIRQILTMATAPAAILDTSTGNIERIRTTTYPTEFGMEQRKALEATLRRKIAKPKYSVLIIGDTQASESSLIEHIKNYASLTYAVDQPLHGIGNLSKSGSSRPLYVESNLPAYEVYQRDTGEAIAVESLATSCKEEEDYRDIIFLRERDVGLRLAPQDPINPSNNIELWLLDSLGLETCDENDGNHAAITIDKLVHIQTFNLIVIIESFKSPLTQERQLALEYFANVFKGLHNRIMFLHTHVSYADLHHTNSVRYLNIKLKNTALSKLFRRFNNEITFDTNNFKEYPSLTIDLVSKKRPVITCLIQNTIREILKMATQPAVLFDTSIQNIERIRAIPCPTQFTDEQLKQAKVRLQANAEKFEEEQAEVVAHTEEQAEVVAPTEEQTEVAAPTEEQAEVVVHTEVQAEKPVKKASRFSYLFAPFRKLVPRRRRMQFECELEGGYGGDQSHYESHHGGIPPLVPIAPIGDLDEVVVEDKDRPSAYNNDNNFPGGPTDGGYYPGGPTDGNNIPGGPSGNGGVVPPVGGGSHSHLPDIIGGVVGGAIIGGAIASHKKKDEETVTHGHVTPVPVPGGPSTSTETTENHHGGSVYPVPVPGGPNSDNSTNQPSGSGGRTVDAERSESGEIRYIIGGIIAGGFVQTITESSSSGSTRISVVSSSTRIITERTSTGEIGYIIVGGFSGNAIRVITERTSTGETRLIPTNEESGELRHVISERSESGEIRYIIGGVITSNTVTHVIMGPRIVTERTSSGEIRYVIIDQYNGNAIRTKFERNEETGEFVHTPVKEPEGELRYVTEERTESGEIRKVIGSVITGNVTTTTRIVSGGVVPEGTSSSSQTRIVSEQTESGEIRYYQITIVDGKEVRTIVERTEDGGFRIPGGAIIVGAGATLIGNNHHTTTATTRVVGGGTLTPAEQAANKTQITLKLSIMRYERADASAAIPSAAVGTVMFSKFKMLAAGDVNIEDTAYSHVEETKAPMSRRTLKWMKTEAHWKREAGMLQHLKSDRYIADLYTLYSLPTFAEYRYVSVLGSFSHTLESYMLTQRLNSLQIRQLTLVLSDALRWCHERHVVHLNVRPSSFYLDGVPGADGTNASGQLIWKLWNFGHARFVGESVDTSVTTMTYAAPEILNACKNKTDPIVLSAVSMDRWSLGLILYELHIGKPYFVNAADAELQLTTNEVSRFQVDLEDVKEMNAKVAIRGLLEVDVEKRYTHETLCEVISAVVTENGITSKLNVPGGNVPKGYSNPKHGAKTAESGSGSDEPSASSSVLVLGKTQAGKSTFIEFVKNYANQQYIINESLLGTGIESKTQMPVQFVVKTPLLSYEVFDATGTRIDIGSLGDQYQDPDDYFDALNNRNATLKPVFHDAASSSPFEEVEITFLDTPGIEDTNGKDAEHAKKIIDAMTKMQSFNLIIIIISCEDTPSKSYQLAFNYYSEVIQTFQGHHSNIVFLYTHVEYEKCHHSNADHLSIMERRHKAFSQLFRRQGSYNHEDVSKSTVEPYPMYNIDFDKRQRPITKCMRLMTLREILTHIVSSPAVALDTSVSNLQQIRNIVHPDEPNQAQWKRLPENTRAIVEQGQGLQGCRDAPTASRECARSLEVNSRGAYNEDRATGLSICGRGDWEGYFPKAMSDCSNSGDEDNDDHADCLDSSVSLGCVARTHCDDMAKMIPAVVQEQ